jgi:DNA-binding NarL/FixJ family response regulator
MSLKGAVEMSEIKLLIAVKNGCIDEHILVTFELEEDMNIVGNTQNIREAIALARKYKPDILLLDIKMINEEGMLDNMVELYSNVKFIIALNDDKDSSEWLFASIAAGASGYISSKLSPEVFMDNIRLVNEGGCVLNPELLPVFLDKFRQYANDEKRTTFLSKVEKQVMNLVINGMNERDIAKRIGTSRHIVKDVIRKTIKKLNVKNISQAVIIALKRKLVDL